MSWNYFKIEEFACNCCQSCIIDEYMVNRLDLVRAELGFPLVVRSGYRCPEHNQRVSTTGPRGPHTTGCAVDIAVSGERAQRLIRVALQREFTGIGVKQHGEHARRFIHLDTLTEGTRPTIWSYP